MQAPEVRNAYKRAGTDVVATDPTAFGRFLRLELDKWGKVVRDLKLQVQ